MRNLKKKFVDVYIYIYIVKNMKNKKWSIRRVIKGSYPCLFIRISAMGRWCVTVAPLTYLLTRSFTVSKSGVKEVRNKE